MKPYEGTKTMVYKLPCKRDLADLRSSGLSNETIRENGLKTEDKCLVFPYRNLDETQRKYRRTKPHKARIVDGKAVKYESPLGSTLQAFFPVAALPKLSEPGATLFITEGEKKALKLSQEGFPTIGLGGIWSGCKPPKTADLIDDLARIDWVGRVVYIVFDYDEKPETRENCRKASRRLSTALYRAGARMVRFVPLPPGENGEKQGADDYLVANSPEDFEQLYLQAEPIRDEIELGDTDGQTEVANAIRIGKRFADEIRYVAEWRSWYVWSGRRWERDYIQVQKHAKTVTKSLWEALRRLRERREWKLKDPRYKALKSFVSTSNSKRAIHAALILTQSEPGIAVSFDIFDPDPLLLNLTNGTYDLNTRFFREHRRGDLITKMAPVAYDPDAECPRFLAFLNRIFAGNENLIGYIQRLVGYGLTGKTTEHILPFFYGEGANGKSTLVAILFQLLGPDYSMKASTDILLASNHDRHPTELADLYGKRLVACIESDAGRRLNESLVKELTGGDRLRARRMREDFFEFQASHKLLFLSNHKPTVRGTDHAIWRRIKLIPFNVIIPKEEMDPDLAEKIAATELPGILNWAIEGCLAWMEEGLNDPPEVLLATDGYRKESDDVGEFISEYCIVSSETVGLFKPMYSTFKENYPDAGLTAKAFGAELERRGFERTKAKANRAARKGVRLKKPGEKKGVKKGS